MAGTINIKLYTISDDNRVVSKTLGTATEFSNCTMKDKTEVVNPTVRIASSSNLSGYNYCHIDRYNRYYYIDKIETTPDGYWLLHCRCDVLMSHKTQLLALTGTLKRSETVYNGYLNDPEYKALAYKKIVTKQFPNAISGDCFVLMTVG